MNEIIEPLISEEEISKRIKEIAKEIMCDFTQGKITLICVLKGGVFFMVDLARSLEMQVEIDFMDVSSYGNSTVSSGQIKIDKDLENPITGKDVLLVEDIIDTGQTMVQILAHLRAQKPNTLKVCTLLDKPERRKVEGADFDYIGFTVPDEFVVGYGLDYAQKYRNLPYIGILRFE
ncbi:MAG: hypoxanthine phosphoribosyltransferase [Defluviitaleaceae bacterium]|nr:hypoxanthine phosphoribosyltransferase [Defluviitaleaceae bacterium]